MGGGEGGTLQEAKKSDVAKRSTDIAARKIFFRENIGNVRKIRQKAKKERSRAPKAGRGNARNGLFAFLRRRDSFCDTFFATFLVSGTAATLVFLIVLFAHNFVVLE